MKRLLLLGAGFSKTWGGPLASEVFNALMTSRAIQQRPQLVALLKTHDANGTGYEGALSDLQDKAERGEAEAHADIVVFQDAVRSIFTAMNTMFFKMPSIDIGNSVDASVRNFLGKFDAIFSLNQDMLLEKHYRDAVNPGYPAVVLPGITPPNQLSPWDHPKWLSEHWTVQDAAPDPKTFGKAQPLFKLHGSSNWRRSDGRDLLVMGGKKMKAVRESPVLTWYHAEFARRLAEHGARLMTIGYGFQDQHVNEPIYNTPGLPIFVVDPAGLKVGLAPKDRSAQIPLPQSDNKLAGSNIIGVSTRYLNTTFGSDTMERQNLETFFQP